MYMYICLPMQQFMREVLLSTNSDIAVKWLVTLNRHKHVRNMFIYTYEYVHFCCYVITMNSHS